MNIKTFRAKTMQQALDLVRTELGPEATVLHTRELNSGLVGRLLKGRQYEIAASTEVRVPTRLPQTSVYESVSSVPPPHPVETDYRSKYRDDFRQQNDGLEELHSLAERLQYGTRVASPSQVPDSLFHIYTDMIESDIEESVARELLEQLSDMPAATSGSKAALQAQLARLLQAELRVTGPIQLTPGQCRVVALVGPTGVGKTTTIAKLAANYRLRENKRVGLITVDTYRIAAVEQLRTYADIIDLPMEVVSTPREMREAIARMRDLDLILMDTAGRSPRDEVKIQELKSMLAESQPDEVHLVLSSVAGAKSLATTAERFGTVGTTALVVTKLDEATCFGNLMSITGTGGLPVSYLTDGQNVPDDICVASKETLANRILGFSALPQPAASSPLYSHA
ncbi:MAG: flagellar biosynthesis protein FlhF [Planctomycetales bacterium]|nr:flagellar biosynthesis protein FlhF [Planctomycetales bacterium]